MHDKNIPRWSALAVLALAPMIATAKPFTMPKTAATMETCLQAAQAKLDGEAVKLEFKTERGAPVYEIEIAGGGKTMEFECDANSGKITEEEQEVENAEHPLFKAKAKIGLAEAQAIALKAHPGKIVETEFEIEANGDASYEFDIATAEGKEVKVEVDAATGKIVEDDEEEIYQIGQE
jgi:uncharacterized membrane protein YkoI